MEVTLVTNADAARSGQLQKVKESFCGTPAAPIWHRHLLIAVEAIAEGRTCPPEVPGVVFGLVTEHLRRLQVTDPTTYKEVVEVVEAMDPATGQQGVAIPLLAVKGMPKFGDASRGTYERLYFLGVRLLVEAILRRRTDFSGAQEKKLLAVCGLGGPDEDEGGLLTSVFGGTSDPMPGEAEAPVVSPTVTPTPTKTSTKSGCVVCGRGHEGACRAVRDLRSDLENLERRVQGLTRALGDRRGEKREDRRDNKRDDKRPRR